jgi:3-hydroxyacyl-[acyl-carrier-protein] dehydratase
MAASEPFFDLDRIDLGLDVADLAARREILRQRGTFELIDAVHVLDRELEVIVASKKIHADDWWAKDHIPGRPLFPGVLMIEASAQAASFHYQSTRPELAKFFIGFGGVEGVRFRASVEPPSTLIFQARLVRARSRMFTYDVQGWVERTLVFEGQIMGIVL